MLGAIDASNQKTYTQLTHVRSRSVEMLVVGFVIINED